MSCLEFNFFVQRIAVDQMRKENIEISKIVLKIKVHCFNNTWGQNTNYQMSILLPQN